jgi:hypothetical protein
LRPVANLLPPRLERNGQLTLSIWFPSSKKAFAKKPVRQNPRRQRRTQGRRAARKQPDRLLRNGCLQRFRPLRKWLSHRLNQTRRETTFFNRLGNSAEIPDGRSRFPQSICLERMQPSGGKAFNAAPKPWRRRTWSPRSLTRRHNLESHRCESYEADLAAGLGWSRTNEPEPGVNDHRIDRLVRSILPGEQSQTRAQYFPG